MTDGRLVVLGGSAGAIESLRQLLQGLGQPLPAAMLVVVHLAGQRPSGLADVLERAGAMPAHQAADGMAIEPGHIYVAAPDNHLLVEDGTLRVVHGPARNRSRPSIDNLFQSAAGIYGERLYAVLLSGTLDDGTAGLAAVKGAGGTTIVQSPGEASFRGMVESAIANVDIDHVLPVAEIARLLERELTPGEAPLPAGGNGHRGAPQENDEEGAPPLAVHPSAPPSGLTCPDCNGSLWELDTNGVPEWECRTGHRYSAQTLLTAIGDEVETALSVALRALEERADFARRMAQRATGREQPWIAERYQSREAEAMRSHRLLAELLQEIGTRDEAPAD